MRFLLYNICYGTHANQRWLPFIGMLGRTEAHLSNIVKFIRSEDPDVVGLIEVDNGSYRSRKKCQAQIIADSLGHFHTYGSKYSSTSQVQRIPLWNKQGNAFLTKNTIQSERFHYFERGMKKLVMELELEHVTFFLVHLALGFKARHEQINHLYHMVKETKRPYIVAGDFNAFMGEREIQLLLAATGLKNADLLTRPSYPSHKPTRHLDFILHSPQIRINRFEVPDVRLSDHLPLVVDFDVLQERGTHD